MPQDLAVHERYWRELAQLTGLTYYPDYTESGLWIHRMVGRVGPYLTLVKFHMASEPLRPVVGVLIRYLPGLDATASTQAIRTEPDLTDYSNKAKQRKGFGLVIGDNYAWFTFPYDPKQEPTELVAEKVKGMVRVISRHGRPTNQCEGPACPTRGSEEPQLALVDNLPLLVCNQCFAQLPDQHAKEKLAYQTTPSGLGRGILAGVGAALLGALVWAMVSMVWDVAAIIVGMITFVGILKVMAHFTTKLTATSVLIVGILTAAHAILGLYLTAIWKVLLTPPISLSQLSISQFTIALQRFVAANSRMVGGIVVYVLFFVTPYLLWIWHVQKRQVELAFQHRIEVVDITRVFRSLH